MPKTRREVAEAVAGAFLPAKRLMVEASAATAECQAVMIRGRFAAKLQPGEGSEILELVQRGAQLSFEAQQCFDKAHALIAPMRRAWNIQPNAFGAEDTPPDTLMGLRSVA